MEILITSKTHRGKLACIGGLVLGTNSFVRLLNPGNWDQYLDSGYYIGDVWDIQYSKRIDCEPPHVEDVIVHKKIFQRKIHNLSEFIKTCGVKIHRGGHKELFEGALSWTTQGSGFVDRYKRIPSNSVGFWINSEELVLDNDGKHYISTNDSLFKIPYVGFESSINLIPANTLLRVSLARWWRPEESSSPERCYLQLSGWYLTPKYRSTMEILFG